MTKRHSIESSSSELSTFQGPYTVVRRLIKYNLTSEVLTAYEP